MRTKFALSLKSSFSSSVLHRTSFTAHKNHEVIQAIEYARLLYFNPWPSSKGSMVFSSWLRTLTYDFYFIILVNKLSLLDWGISSCLFGSYESLNKEVSSPFLKTKFALSLKSSFSSCKVKKAFETLTEEICNLLN